MWRERIARLLGNPPPPLGWPLDKNGFALLPVSIEHQLGMIRWNNTISAVSIAAELEALSYLPMEECPEPENDLDTEASIDTIPCAPRRVA